MALTPGSAVFLDTNILVYASFPGTPFYDAARTRLDQLENDGALFWTSRQVLREYLASTTRPGAIVPPPTVAALSQAVRLFEAEFEIAGEDAAVTALLLELLKSRTIQGKQIQTPTSSRRYGALRFPGC
ncbi:MAG: type II toxin-antitoxin system VapC family toxin [Bryobacteraceae bacterium]|jgi:predicted nucleic acid-binding protein